MGSLNVLAYDLASFKSCFIKERKTEQVLKKKKRTKQAKICRCLADRIFRNMD